MASLLDRILGRENAVNLAEQTTPRTDVRKKLFAPKGVPGEAVIGSFNDEERRVDDLKLTDYRRMKDNDGQVQMLLNAINNTIISAGVTIEDDPDFNNDSESEEKKESEEKQFIEKVLLSSHNKGGMKKSIDYINRINLRAFEEGFRVFEPVYKVGEEGKIVLDYLAPRAGLTDYDFTLLADDKGDFLGFKQRTTFKGQRIDVEVKNESEIRRVFKATFGEEYGSLYGRSGLKAAWYHYDKIHRLLYLLSIATELGSVKFREYKSTGKMSEQQRDEILGVLARFGSEQAIAHDGSQGELFIHDLSDAGVMTAGLELINKSYSLIAKSVLAQFIDLGSESASTGSRSLGESQTIFFKQGLQSLATILIESFWNEVITDLIKMNFDNGIYPTLKVGQIDSTISDKLMEMFVEMVKSGKISEKSSEEIELKTSHKLGLDVTPEDIQESREKQEQEKQIESEQNMEIAMMKKAPPVNASDVELTEPIARPLFPDEKKVDLDKIRSQTQIAEDSLLTEMRNIFDADKNKIVNKYLEALRTGRSEVNKVKVDLRYGPDLKATALKIHQLGKVTAADELDIPAPKTNNDETKIVTSNIDLTIKEQEARLEARLARTANGLLQTNLSEVLGTSENKAREVIEQDLTSFFNSIDTATAGSVVGDNLTRGRGYTFNQNKQNVFAYRYTAVMDSHTTDFCRALDGRVFQDIDPQFIMLTPPNHYNAIVEGGRVTTNNGEKRIQDVEIGEMVMTHKGRYSRVYDTMNKFEDKEFLVIELEDGSFIELTGEHPVFTDRGWIRADKLSFSDDIITIQDVQN